LDLQYLPDLFARPSYSSGYGRLLGKQLCPPDSRFRELVGRLSELPTIQAGYAIADDRSQKAPCSVLSLSSTTQGSLKDGGVVPVGMTTLLDETNQPFAAGSLDPEGIALKFGNGVYLF